MDGSSPTYPYEGQTEAITFTAGSDDVSHFRIVTTRFNTSGEIEIGWLEWFRQEEPANSEPIMASLKVEVFKRISLPITFSSVVLA
ncbi:hypothetical protein OH492_09215 [Vibrio chagasii]|nr:hypothetical protein [Vibrio chagasii]